MLHRLRESLMMTLYTPWAAALLLALGLLWLELPCFAAADQSWHPSSARTATLDGLRGLLASGVFLHHATLYALYLTQQRWQTPPSFFYTQLGQASVILFFMITGFLFWDKALACAGRLSWPALWWNRYFRIAPLYYLAVALMLLVVAIRTGFIVHVSLTQLLKELAPLLLAGYQGLPASINSYPRPGLILAGVTWTLHYEWIFYLFFLPVASFFARRQSWQRLLVGVGTLSSFIIMARHPGIPRFGMAAFFAGMLCASLQRESWGAQLRLLRRRYPVQSSALLLILAVLLMSYPGAYATRPMLLLGLSFFMISSGTDLFGVLLWRPTRRLGELSYGIYILQGPVLYGVFALAPLRHLALRGAWPYWLVLALAYLLLLSLAWLAHQTIELPGIRLGRKTQPWSR